MAIICPFKTRATYVKHTIYHLLSAIALIKYDNAQIAKSRNAQKYTQPKQKQPWHSKMLQIVRDSV